MHTPSPFDPTLEHDGEYIFSVSELNQSVKQLLEKQLGRIWILGEISGFSRPSSGHIYFTLKDARAQIRCAFFRQQHRLTTPPLENGQMVLVCAKPSLYSERGDYQLIVEQIQLHGAGQLQQQYEELKQRLQQMGLFATEHKKPLPRLPQCIGLITSPTGAAIEDVLTVLKQRFPLTPIRLYPSSVQGEAAANILIQAIETANHEQQCDVLLLTRGGGAIEDLWCFNDEALAHAIFNSTIPIVSAVGHEIDFTIADFVADQRAPTPSAGAALITPDQLDIQQRLDHLQNRMMQAMQGHLSRAQQAVQIRQSKLIHPRTKLHQQQEKLQQYAQQLEQHMQRQLQQKNHQLAHYRTRLDVFPWQRIFAQQQQTLAQRHAQLQQKFQQLRQGKSQRLAQHAQKLEDLSPLHTLKRGYAMIRDAQTDQPLHAKQQMKTKQKIKITLHDGEVTAHCE